MRVHTCKTTEHIVENSVKHPCRADMINRIDHIAQMQYLDRIIEDQGVEYNKYNYKETSLIIKTLRGLVVSSWCKSYRSRCIAPSLLVLAYQTLQPLRRM